MKIIVKTLILATAFFLMQDCIFAQTSENSWKMLSSGSQRKIWYDSEALDTATSHALSIWTLELHKPPLKIEGVSAPVFKSQTLYNINFDLLRYGIAKIVYFDASDKIIFQYDYQKLNTGDDYKYSYPIMDDNQMVTLLKKYIKIKELKEN